ncbi:MAG: glycosyl hydrolase family 57 [Myxococcota bacterium]
MLPESVNGTVNLSGSESLIEKTLAESRDRRLYPDVVDFGGISSSFAIALHMHQPLVPAGGSDLRTAAVISNLRYMFENQHIGDNHNAPVFAWCYKRMGELVPQLIHEGKQPRVMLDYSGTLLLGLREMGADDVIDTLKTITCNPDYMPAVEWLGTSWGHAVAPSTPVQDFRLHVRAFQHHFAAMFGLDALARLRGFSPAEMALPNHPEVAYAFVRTLRDCGYQWVLVQEHSVEQPEDGEHPQRRHIPHRLVCRNARGETASITAIIKTQGSDSKLVGQMQPYYEAMGLSREPLGGHRVPPIVTQIADGENGGVMMNEFPPKYLEVIRACSGSSTPAMNVSEYLEYLAAVGVSEADLPRLQPVQQKKIWDRIEPGAGPEALAKTIKALSAEDHHFHMDGGSWTNDLSWVRGYEDVLGPMEEASARFHEKLVCANVPTDHPAYRNALYHLLMSQTSCYRYWGQGQWTDYGRELCRRTLAILEHDV